MLFTGLYWGINNSLSPYVLKLIIDKAVAFESDKLAVFHAVMPYCIIYLLLWIFIALDLRLVDWIRLKLFPSLRQDLVTNMFSYLNQHSHRYFQNNFAGSLANKISDMTSGVITIFTTLDDAFAQCVGLSIAIITMLLVHPIFALILFIWAIAFILIAILFFKPVHDLANVFATSKTTLVGKYENALIQETTLDTVKKDRAMQWVILKMRIYWDISIIVLIGLNLYMLVSMYSKNQVSIGDFR